MHQQACPIAPKRIKGGEERTPSPFPPSPPRHSCQPLDPLQSLWWIHDKTPREVAIRRRTHHIPHFLWSQVKLGPAAASPTTTTTTTDPKEKVMVAMIPCGAVTARRELDDGDGEAEEIFSWNPVVYGPEREDEVRKDYDGETEAETAKRF